MVFYTIIFIILAVFIYFTLALVFNSIFGLEITMTVYLIALIITCTSIIYKRISEIGKGGTDEKDKEAGVGLLKEDNTETEKQENAVTVEKSDETEQVGS